MGVVSEMAMHFFERMKIMVIKCPSKIEIARLCKLTGATSLARFGAPLPEEIGTCDRVSARDGRAEVQHLHPGFGGVDSCCDDCAALVDSQPSRRPPARRRQRRQHLQAAREG